MSLLLGMQNDTLDHIMSMVEKLGNLTNFFHMTVSNWRKYLFGLPDK